MAVSKLTIKVKKEFNGEVVGFNGSPAPLGQRDDLYMLAEYGLTCNPSLLNFFDQVPTLDDIQAYKAQLFLQANPAPTTPAAGQPQDAGNGTPSPATASDSTAQGNTPAPDNTPAQ